MRIDNPQARKYNVAEYLFKENANERLEEIDEALDQIYCDHEDRDTREAFRRYLKGEQLSFSTGAFCEMLTAGFGRISDYGYWDFPLPGDFIDTFYGVK